MMATLPDLSAMAPADQAAELAARFALAKDSLVAFRSLLLPSKGDCVPAPFMERWSDIILNGKKNFAVEAFRESGKSQVALRSNLLHALTFPRSDRSFIVIIRATRDLAAALLQETSREWQTRPELMTQPDGSIPEIIEDSGKALQVRYKNGMQVRIVAFGKGGSIRGLSWGAKRPDLVVCDDIQDLEDVSSETVTAKDWAWFMSDIYFLGHESRIFMIGNNLGERCIIERLLKESDVWGFDVERIPKMIQTGDDWKSLWPSRYSIQNILNQKEAFARKGMSDIWYREMLCEARSPATQRFRRDMFRYYDPRTVRRDELSVYMTVDLASSKANSADYSVCCVVGVQPSGMWQTLDVFYGRVTPSEHMNEIFNMVQKWRPICVGIENVQYQAAMLDFLQKEMPRRNIFFNIQPLMASSHKEQRIDMLQPRFAVGSVWFPVGAAWLQEMEGELLAFPTGAHDDLIDALAYMEQIAQAPVMGYSESEIDIPEYGGI